MQLLGLVVRLQVDAAFLVGLALGMALGLALGLGFLHPRGQFEELVWPEVHLV